MAEAHLIKTSFSAGEVSPSLVGRRDTVSYRDGAKRMRNVRLLVTGGFRRRAGSCLAADLGAAARLYSYVFSPAQAYVLAFGDGVMSAYFAEDGAAAGGLTGCPWTAAMLPALNVTPIGDTICVLHEDLPTQVVTRTGASTWSRTTLAFRAGPGGEVNQPYWKFADHDVTLQPSARTGSVTLTASASVFTAQHVGARLRWAGSEMTVTGFTNGTTITATVVNELPITQRITLASTSGFLPGHVIEGDLSGAKGEVVTIVSATELDAVVINSMRAFQAAEDVTSPLTKSTSSAVSTVAPGAIKDWSEQMQSAARGWFSCATVHRNRLILGGHKSFPSAVAMSRTADHFDFDLGDAKDDDAVIEPIGEAITARVRHFVSHEQLIVLTDSGIFYVPESNANPLTATSVSFFRISGDGVGDAPPGIYDKAILIPDRLGKRVLRVAPTGDLTRSWLSTDVALIASHLLSGPVDSAFSEGDGESPERYGYIVNADGTMAILHQVAEQDLLGWCLWTTEGYYRSATVVDGRVYVAVERVIGAQTVHWLERLDRDRVLDATTEIPADNATLPDYAGHTVHAVKQPYSFGPVDVDGVGNLVIDTGGSNLVGPFEIGMLFEPEVETLPPQPAGSDGGDLAARLMRIARVWVETIATHRISVEGHALAFRRIGEPTEQAPPGRTGPQMFRLSGWKRNPTLMIRQPDPASLEVASLTMEVFV